MSYFEFFCENIKNDKSQNSDTIVGTCYSMCPKEEITLREREKLVHVLEVMGDERKLVKCYSRSAADSNMAVPRYLRPYSVLKDTVKYLLLEVAKRKDVGESMVYDFINDRFRAVRQDMTIQRLPSEECVTLLEPMIKFYVYFSYRLCEYPVNDFDPVLNKKYLLECIKWYLNCCDTISALQTDEKIDELTGFLSKLEIMNKNSKLACDRVLIESLYILCNLGDRHPLFRYLSLPKYLKSEESLRLAYKISSANQKGMYIHICRAVTSLCPLTYCALFLHLSVIQRKALHIMSNAYNSKQLAVPCSVLTKWLLFTSTDELKTVCTHYGLQVDGHSVRFMKGDFKTDVPLHKPKKNKLYEELLNLNLENIFTYVPAHRK